LAAPPPWRISLTRFDAVIFDMDGVLVDGEPLHFEAVNEILGAEGRSMSFEQYRPHMGTKYGWGEMIPQFGLSHSHEHYRSLFRDLMTERYSTRSAPLPGAVQLVRGLQRAHMPLSIASSSIRVWVEACLTRIGLRDAFPQLTTGDEVTIGKPDPAIYSLAASRLNVPPANILVFEDAPAGIVAAKAAGMTCWAVRTEYTRGLALPNPDREFESLTDIDLTELAGAPV
jgi:HAD superfamily hydrolase (TIGR01509 family)